MCICVTNPVFDVQYEYAIQETEDAHFYFTLNTICQHTFSWYIICGKIKYPRWEVLNGIIFK